MYVHLFDPIEKKVGTGNTMAGAREIFPPFMANRYCEHDMRFQQINDVNVALIVLGKNERYPLYTSCVAKKDLANFLKIDAEIQEKGQEIQNGMIYKPLPGELIMAKTDEFGWTRCHFIEKEGSKAKVYCLDYGVFHQVDETDIRVINQIIFLQCYIL